MSYKERIKMLLVDECRMQLVTALDWRDDGYIYKRAHEIAILAASETGALADNEIKDQQERIDELEKKLIELNYRFDRMAEHHIREVDV